MPRILPNWGTKVSFRNRKESQIHTKTFRGEDHAVKAAQFAVANKREWDYHLLETLEPH